MWLAKSPKVVKGESRVETFVLPVLREVLHVGLFVLDLADVLENNLQVPCLMLRGNNQWPLSVMFRGIYDVLDPHMMRLREIPRVVISH